MMTPTVQVAARIDGGAVEQQSADADADADEPDIEDEHIRRAGGLDQSRCLAQEDAIAGAFARSRHLCEPCVCVDISLFPRVSPA